MKYNKLIECTITNGYEIHTDSALLVCTNESFESIDIINDFHFNHSYKVIDVSKTIHLEDIGDLYKYLIEKNIYINRERILDSGILVGEGADYLLQQNLRANEIA